MNPQSELIYTLERALNDLIHAAEIERYIANSIYRSGSYNRIIGEVESLIKREMHLLNLSEE